MKKYSLIIIAAFASLLATGQNLLNELGERHEKIEAYKVAYYSRRMDLTPDEAKVFWPQFNAYEATIRGIHKKKRKAIHEVDQDVKDINKLIDTHFGYEQNIIDVKRNFYQKLTSMLPPEKVMVFFKAEKEFTRKLLRMAIKKRMEKRRRW